MRKEWMEVSKKKAEDMIPGSGGKGVCLTFCALRSESAGECTRSSERQYSRGRLSLWMSKKHWP